MKKVINLMSQLTSPLNQDQVNDTFYFTYYYFKILSIKPKNFFEKKRGGNWFWAY